MLRDHLQLLILRYSSEILCRYFLFGWAFAYGDKLDDSGNSIGNAFIGTNQFAMSTTDASKFNTFVFQYVVRPLPRRQV